MRLSVVFKSMILCIVSMCLEIVFMSMCRCIVSICLKSTFVLSKLEYEKSMYRKYTIGAISNLPTGQSSFKNLNQFLKLGRLKSVGISFYIIRLYFLYLNTFAHWL